MKAGFEAAIFDFDGLLIDTEGPWYDVFREIYARFGQTLTSEQWSVFVGTHDPAHDWYTMLSPYLDKGVTRESLAEETSLMHRARMESTTLRPGVLDYLTAAREFSLKIGLASSSSASWIYPFLEQHELRPYFSVICTADDVTRVKPDPALYLLACERLCVSPKAAIAFEDSPNGARAAKAAGLACVVVPNVLTANYPFDEHDARLSSMAEQTLDTLLERLGR